MEVMPLSIGVTSFYFLCRRKTVVQHIHRNYKGDAVITECLVDMLYGLMPGHHIPGWLVIVDPEPDGQLH